MDVASDSWVNEFNEASNLAEEIGAMIAEMGSFPPYAPDTQRYLRPIERKITILRDRLERLESSLTTPPSEQSMMNEEFHKRRDMLANMKAKASHMSSNLNILNMSSCINRMGLLVGGKQMDAVSRTAMGLRRQIMKEQDENLEILEETITSTEHIALAVNEELSLRTRLIDDLDEHVDVTESKLQIVQKRLTILNKHAKGCLCTSLGLSTVAIVIFVVLAWLLINVEDTKDLSACAVLSV